ncbi:hypothetical protein KP803_17425 [Vibrio sp. ZSDE26]|uniref:Uncharacterized protein n=1 Tax=Vibrio amylolyticus TaxID=2847292 RepID=A0A9X1XKQ6_9VIBR|nr:hypothetical protein [Vibrio amylolyticus]MCK6265062.1 hypothetical protein [Vibrio amylolyticus]
MTFPRVLKHGKIEPITENIYWVRGSVKLKAPHPKFGPLTLQFSRNMTIIKQGDELILVNSVRLDEETLEQLDSLGKVKHVVRLAAFHGMDDPFYKNRYDVTIWSVNAPYFSGVDPNPPEAHYFAPDKLLSSKSLPPIPDLKYFEIGSGSLNEGLFYLERENGIAISGDSLQNWHQADENFNLTARFMMKKMGFIRPTGIGPGWVNAVKPDVSELFDFFDWGFETLIPSHGEPITSAASEAFRSSVEKIIDSKKIESRP